MSAMAFPPPTLSRAFGMRSPRVVNKSGESMGQRGLLPPMLAAWGPDALLLILASLRLRLAGIHR